MPKLIVDMRVELELDPEYDPDDYQGAMHAARNHFRELSICVANNDFELMKVEQLP